VYHKKWGGARESIDKKEKKSWRKKIKSRLFNEEQNMQLQANDK